MSEIALRDAQGRMLAPLPGAKPIRSSERARELSNKRWEDMRRKSNQRIVAEAAAIDPTVKTPSDAFALVVSKQYVALVDSDKPKMADVEKLGYLISGKDRQNSRRENEADLPPGALLASPSALVELVALIEQQQRRAVDAARAADAAAGAVVQIHEVENAETAEK
jgi:hypothetical protein